MSGNRSALQLLYLFLDKPTSTEILIWASYFFCMFFQVFQIRRLNGRKAVTNKVIKCSRSKLFPYFIKNEGCFFLVYYLTIVMLKTPHLHRLYMQTMETEKTFKKLSFILININILVVVYVLFINSFGGKGTLDHLKQRKWFKNDVKEKPFTAKKTHIF